MERSSKLFFVHEGCKAVIVNHLCLFTIEIKEDSLKEDLKIAIYSK